MNETQFAPHQQRVVDEKDELDEKIAALDKFINESPIFNNLNFSERELLVKQYVVMRQYSKILDARILAF